ncbi:MAG: HU family DNA-binding protein [Parabacteroides sp.]|nr:HU family DNA-binding protein [Parabacteroides sp.]MDY4846891.1 HU family DNA-binding protein [Parabacteroides sp.]
MKKSTLISESAKKAGLTLAQTKAALEAICEVIRTDVVVNQDKIILPGFGTFDSVVRPARTGINPATMEKIQIPETRKVKFKPSKEGWF